jgi:hypothetical protein
MTYSHKSDVQFLHSSAGKAGEILAVYDWNDDVSFLHVYRNLYSLFGGDEKLMRHWMHVSNQHLKGRFPADLLKTKEGIDEILNYLASFSNWS